MLPPATSIKQVEDRATLGDARFVALLGALRSKGVRDGAVRHCVHFGLPREPELIFDGKLDIDHTKESPTSKYLAVEVAFEDRLTRSGLFGVREVRDPVAVMKYVIRWLKKPLP